MIDMMFTPKKVLFRHLAHPRERALQQLDNIDELAKSQLMSFLS
jgi:hypothetical protein